MLGSACGRSTTNSVRCAGNTCSLSSTGRPSASDVIRSQRSTGEPDGHLEQLGVAGVGRGRADRLHRAAESARRAARRTATARRRRATAAAPSVLGAPHRDAGERLAVGQVEPAHLEHLSHAEHLRGRGPAAATKPKSRMRRSDAHARRRRAAPRSCRAGRATGGAGRRPRTSRSPGAASTSPSSRSSLERLADRDPAGRRTLPTARPRSGSSRPAANSPASTRRRRSSAISR